MTRVQSLAQDFLYALGVAKKKKKKKKEKKEGKGGDIEQLKYISSAMNPHFISHFLLCFVLSLLSLSFLLAEKGRRIVSTRSGTESEL